MQRYILTDRDGHTAGGERIEAGRFARHTGSGPDTASRILGQCCATPVFAVLAHPAPPPDARLFCVQHWSVGTGSDDAAYTVVKEVKPVPAVSTDQRLTFAVAVLHEALRNREFRHWADAWLNGDDRSAATARAVREALERESAAASDLSRAGLGEVAEAVGQSVDTQTDLARRALALLLAAEQSASGRGGDAALGEALLGIEAWTRELDLAALEERLGLQK